MKPSSVSTSALKLGVVLALTRWRSVVKDYSVQRKLMEECLVDLPFTLTLPNTLEEYLDRSAEYTQESMQALSKEREMMGGDVYGLPLFFLGGLALDAVVEGTFGGGSVSEGVEEALRLVLNDLSIESAEPEIRTYIDLETRWLQKYASLHDGQIALSDAAEVTERVVDHVLSLWRVAERHPFPLELGASFTYSATIVGASSDRNFCLHLYDAFLRRGVRPWLESVDLRGGQKRLDQIESAMRDSDRLVFVTSEESMACNWTAIVLAQALELEAKRNETFLFPVALASPESIRSWKLRDVDLGKDIAKEVRGRGLTDFRNWREPESFDATLEALLRAMASPRVKVAR